MPLAAGAHGKALLAAASASTQIKDPNCNTNAVAGIITLGANKTGAQARAGAQDNPYDLGPALTSTLAQRTLHG